MGGNASDDENDPIPFSAPLPERPGPVKTNPIPVAIAAFVGALVGAVLGGQLGG